MRHAEGPRDPVGLWSGVLVGCSIEKIPLLAFTQTSQYMERVYGRFCYRRDGSSIATVHLFGGHKGRGGRCYLGIIDGGKAGNSRSHVDKHLRAYIRHRTLAKAQRSPGIIALEGVIVQLRCRKVGGRIAAVPPAETTAVATTTPGATAAGADYSSRYS